MNLQRIYNFKKILSGEIHLGRVEYIVHIIRDIYAFTCVQTNYFIVNFWNANMYLLNYFFLQF